MGHELTRGHAVVGALGGGGRREGVCVTSQRLAASVQSINCWAYHSSSLISQLFICVPECNGAFDFFVNKFSPYLGWIRDTWVSPKGIFFLKQISLKMKS